MKFQIFLFLFIFSSLFVNAQKKWNTLTETKLIGQYLSKKQFDLIYKKFNSSLKESVSIGQIEQIWTNVISKDGGFKSFEKLSQTKYNNLPVGHLICVLKNGKQELVVNYNLQGQVTGFFFSEMK